jgi:heme A synthase
VSWTALALRKRFGNSGEISKARVALHVILGVQFLLGWAAWWSRLATAETPQPMPVMVSLTVVHTVVGALLLASSVIVALVCYRLVPRRREVVAATERRVGIA